MLFVSSSLRYTPTRIKAIKFQSRNRDAFRFKLLMGSITPLSTSLFQSRNRDAFRFKGSLEMLEARIFTCFNLGIEMLFVSSMWRNKRTGATTESFNLGIEMLFVSRQLIYYWSFSEHQWVSISESRCFSFQDIKE